MGKLLGLMYLSHDACMVVSRGVVSLGSFLCSVVEGRSRVALSVSREARRAVFGPGLSAFGSLTMSTFVGAMWRDGVVFFSVVLYSDEVGLGVEPLFP